MSDEVSQSYDAIVIGSGIGGMTAASILAQIGNRKVLVLESHFKLGGFTHAFRRGKYEWDVGVHYVGEMQPGAMSRRVMDLITRHKVDWRQMQSPIERFIFSGDQFEVPQGRRAYEQALRERFPDDAIEIKRYFKDVLRAQAWMARWFVSKQLPRWLASLLLTYGRKNALECTATRISRLRNPVLRGILTGQWPDFGTPPDKSAFGFHATVSADFFNGGYYPIGGSKQLAKTCAEAIVASGGKCLVGHKVCRIITRRGRAMGVVAEHKGKELRFSAPVIISNAGAIATFERLVPADECVVEKEKCSRLQRGVSAIVLFLGLKEDPKLHGFDEANYWLYRRLDHDVQAKFRDGEPERIDGAFVSFGSMRDPLQSAHTAQIITFTDQSPWGEFADTQWMHRGQEYLNRKRQVTEQMLDFVEERLPGLRGLVDYAELSTPLTVESFTGHANGMVYGQPCDEARLFRDAWPVCTSLKNLFLTGSDVGTPGVNGAMMAGVMTAAKVLGVFGLPRIMTRAFTQTR